MATIPRHYATQIGRQLLDLAYLWGADDPHYIALSSDLYTAAREADETGKPVTLTITVDPEL